MVHRIAADLIVFIHFTWILFMLYGFIRTAYTAVIYFRTGQTEKAKKFFNRWIFRTVHVCGIFYVGLLTVLREFCPLTIAENTLRSRHDPTLTYPGSFMVHYIERFVYPDVNPMLIITGTVVVAAFTLLIFVIRPPAKIKRVFTR
jgi:hypothetical protein